MSKAWQQMMVVQFLVSAEVEGGCFFPLTGCHCGSKSGIIASSHYEASIRHMALKAIQTELCLTPLPLFLRVPVRGAEKLVCCWYKIDKVILDALLRDVPQYFLTVEKYVQIHIWDVFNPCNFRLWAQSYRLALMQRFSLNYTFWMD